MMRSRLLDGGCADVMIHSFLLFVVLVGARLMVVPGGLH